jgi:Alginate export
LRARIGFALALGLLAGGAAAPASADASAASARPAYQFLPQNEDWSRLRDAAPGAPRDFWDPIKYVPLGDRVWASFGASLRGRLEHWSDFNFGAATPEDDDTFALSRLLIHGDLQLGERARVFVQMKSSLATHRDLPGGVRTLDVDSVALQQGFADVRLASRGGRSLTARLGRQSYLYGRQRLVSPLPWANTLRAWDGATARLALPGWNVDGFWSLFAPVRQYEFNRPDPDEQFYGVYATGRRIASLAALELYALGRSRNPGPGWNGTRGYENRLTLGTRIATPLGFDWLALETEGAYQLGRIGGASVRAYMFTAELTATAAGWWSAPRFELTFDYASGDHRPGGDVQTFDQLYPLAHAYLGYMDFVGRQNSVAVSPELVFTPLRDTRFEIAGHVFRRAERLDAFYNGGGVAFRPGGPGTSRAIGGELDAVLRHSFGRHLAGELGYGHFFPGAFLEAATPGNGMDFFYAQLEYRL